MPAASEIGILAPDVIQGSALPRRLRRRGRFTRLAARQGTELLAYALGVAPEELAAAPLHYLGMTGADPAGYCLFAYPVHLHARREQLILMTGEELDVTESEAVSLIETLQAYYPEWRFERTRDGMWFLIVDETPDLVTTPLDRVLGENINEHLPRGADAMRWLSVMNEMQMILFDTPVNEQREAAGRPVLNSLWLWGGGRLPAPGTPRWRRVVTNDPVTLGAARRAGIEARWLEGPLADENVADPELTTAGTLWVCGRTAPGDATEPVVTPRQWQVLQDALRRRRIDALTLIEPGHGELRIDAGKMKWWRPWR